MDLSHLPVKEGLHKFYYFITNLIPKLIDKIHVKTIILGDLYGSQLLTSSNISLLSRILSKDSEMDRDIIKGIIWELDEWKGRLGEDVFIEIVNTLSNILY